MASQFALVPYRLQSKLPAEMAHADRDTTQRCAGWTGGHALSNCSWHIDSPHAWA